MWEPSHLLFPIGLPEAQNEKGELLGFESARALAQEDAEAIAQAAIALGQKDGITVVVIQREGAPAKPDGTANVSGPVAAPNVQ
jgi:hypothetical protein